MVGKHLLVVKLLLSSCMAEMALHPDLLAVSVLAAKKPFTKQKMSGSMFIANQWSLNPWFTCEEMLILCF